MAATLPGGEMKYVSGEYQVQLEDLAEDLMEKYRETHAADNVVVYLQWLKEHGHPGYAEIIEGVGNEPGFTSTEC